MGSFTMSEILQTVQLAMTGTVLIAVLRAAVDVGKMKQMLETHQRWLDRHDGEIREAFKMAVSARVHESE